MTKQTVWRLVAAIPPGKVATYGQLAALAGNPKAARAVVRALKGAPAALPCHRVVNRAGTLAPQDVFGPGMQKALLLAEGVAFLADGKINMRQALWAGPEHNDFKEEML